MDAHGLFSRTVEHHRRFTGTESDLPGGEKAFTNEGWRDALVASALASIAETFRLLARHWVWNVCLKKLEDDPWPEEKSNVLPIRKEEETP